MKSRTIIPEGAKAKCVFLSLRDDITAGTYAAGQTLPGEQKLATTFAVSRVTIRRALVALCHAGMIERRAGVGTVVCGPRADAARVAVDVNTLMPQLAEMSRATTARLLSFSYGNPPDKVAEAMGLSAGERVQIATRVRLTEGLPFSHLTTYVPEAIASHYSERDLADNPLFSLLERSGVAIASAHQSVSATLANPAVAEALDVSIGTALLSLQRIVCDHEGRGVEYLDARYRPDRFSLEMTLARVGDSSQRHWEPAIAPASAIEQKRA